MTSQGSGLPQLPPPATAINKPDDQTGPDQKKGALFAWTGTAVGGFFGGYLVGTFGPAFYLALGGTPEGITAVSTVAIAGFTYALVLATREMREEARATLGQMKNSSHRELRAYLGISAPRPPVFPPQAGQPVAYALEIHNFGKTPAYDVTLRIGSQISRYPHPSGYAFPANMRDRASESFELNPGETRVIRSGDREPTSPEYAAAIGTGATGSIDGEVALCVCGIVTYRDAFDGEHGRPFCHFHLAPDGRTSYCLQHNGEGHH